MGMIIPGDGTSAYTDETGAYAVNVRYANGDRWRANYVWSIWSDGNLLATGDELSGPTHQGPREALGSLVTFLVAEGERYAYTLSFDRDEPDGGWTFPPAVAEWAYRTVEELWTAAEEIGIGAEHG